MRSLAILVADVLDEMLAADFEDGFAPLEETHGDADWMAIHELALRDRSRSPHPRRPDANAGTSRGRHRRPGQVPTSPMPCVSPVRGCGGTQRRSQG